MRAAAICGLTECVGIREVSMPSTSVADLAPIPRRSLASCGMDRRTKIVATVGPASDDVVTLGRMIAAGMDMGRRSLAHGPREGIVNRLHRNLPACLGRGRILGVLA